MLSFLRHYCRSVGADFCGFSFLCYCNYDVRLGFKFHNSKSRGQVFSFTFDKYFLSFKDGEENDDPGIGSTESLREWGRSAFERPVPIQYQLLPIMDLFQKSHLPNVDEAEQVIGTKNNCMKKALKDYCSKVAADLGDCVSYDDGSSEPNAVRYGDLIAIQKGLTNSKSEYLEVPESKPIFAIGTEPEYMKVNIYSVSNFPDNRLVKKRKGSKWTLKMNRHKIRRCLQRYLQDVFRGMSHIATIFATSPKIF